MDEVVPIANKACEVNGILLELNAGSKEVDPRINAKRTKVMQSTGILRATLRVDSVDLEEVHSYVHLDRK